MTAEHSAVPLQLTCTRCGGNPPVNFAVPIACPYCGGVDTLEPDILDRIREVRRRIQGRDAGIRQFNDRQFVFSMKYRKRAVRYLPFLFFFWVLTAMIFFGTVGELLGHDFSITGLVTLTHVPAGTDAPLAWWVLYGASIWFAFSFFIPSLSFFRAGRIIEDTKPYPPHTADNAPRCRNCMSPLPKTGTVRRCPACGTDHLVIGDSYREEQTSIDDAIRQSKKAVEKNLRVRIARSENILGSAFLIVLLSIGGVPVLGGILSALLKPALWYYIIPLIFFGIFFTFYIRSWRRITSLLNRIDMTPAVDPGESP